MPFESTAYVVHEAGGPIQLEQVTYQDPGPTEIVVENVAFSMCASDVKAAEGKFFLKPPLIPGHESAGIGGFDFVALPSSPLLCVSRKKSRVSM